MVAEARVLDHVAEYDVWNEKDLDSVNVCVCVFGYDDVLVNVSVGVIEPVRVQESFVYETSYDGDGEKLFCHVPPVYVEVGVSDELTVPVKLTSNEADSVTVWESDRECENVPVRLLW